MRKFKTIIGTIIFLVLGVAFFLTRPPSPNQLVILTESGDQVIEVEIASTPEEKIQGLMFREKIGENQGMLFVYEEASSPIIWMKNMLISLDILFIGEDLSINHIERMVPPCDQEDDSLCDRYSSKKSVNYFLELPAGTADAIGIEVGDSVTLPSLLSESS